MQCASHPERTATAMCTRCDKTLCPDCAAERNGKPFCAACAEFLDQRAAHRPPRPEAAAPVPPPAVPDGAVAGPPPLQAHAGVAAAAGDVYQGPDDVYQGPGDVYQGPPPGDLHGGTTVGGAVAAQTEGSLVRGAILGLVAAALSMGLFYGVAVATDRIWVWVALIVGAVVGGGTLLGTGRHGSDVATLSAALFVVAIVGAQYMIQNRFYQQGLAAERSVAHIEMDGRYTDEEARLLLDMSEDEWSELSSDDRRGVHAMLREEHAEEFDEDWDEAAYQREMSARPDSLPFGDFLSFLPGTLGFFGFLCLAVGGWEAFKIPLGGG